MVDPTLEHQRLGLSGRDLAIALAIKYAILTVYGGWAIIAEVPSFVLVGGAAFATGWAVTVTVFSLFALLGLGRTWFTGRFRLEKWSTIAFALAMVTYSVVLIVRAVIIGNVEAAPLCLIPLALITLPMIRYYSLVGRSQ